MNISFKLILNLFDELIRNLFTETYSKPNLSKFVLQKMRRKERRALILTNMQIMSI